MSSELEPRVRQIVADVLQKDPSEVPPDAGIDRLAGWDSMNQLSIVVAIEEEFGRSIPPGDVARLSSISALVEFLRRESPG
jgi:acyl carrier protein